jgi:hypothetical protein
VLQIHACFGKKVKRPGTRPPPPPLNVQFVLILTHDQTTHTHSLPSLCWQAAATISKARGGGGGGGGGGEERRPLSSGVFVLKSSTAAHKTPPAALCASIVTHSRLRESCPLGAAANALSAAPQGNWRHSQWRMAPF